LFDLLCFVEELVRTLLLYFEEYECRLGIFHVQRDAFVLPHGRVGDNVEHTCHPGNKEYPENP